MLVNEFKNEIECENELGECVLWHPSEKRLYWTDIEGKCLYRYDPISEHKEIFCLPYRLASFAFTDRPCVLFCAFDHSIAVYDMDSGELSHLNLPFTLPEGVRFNDGKCSHSGNLFLGSMLENKPTKKDISQDEMGALIKISKQGSYSGKGFAYQKIRSSIRISNAMAFSPCGRFAYHTDTITRKVYEFTLDPEDNDAIISKRLFCKFEKGAYPDGACVDKHGNLWIALWGAACVVCIAGDANEKFRLPLPVTQASCVTIGGENMDLLFVTSARLGLTKAQLERQPRAGSLLMYQLNEPIGVAEPMFCL